MYEVRSQSTTCLFLLIGYACLNECAYLCHEKKVKQ